MFIHYAETWEYRQSIPILGGCRLFSLSEVTRDPLQVATPE